MTDLRRISGLAVVLIVLLRLSIGWHLFYEGIWKIDSQSSAQPWSAEGYLRNAEGPFREHFRQLTGDPDDLRWLDYEWVVGHWTDYYNRFVAHHTDLSNRQKSRLYDHLYGPEIFVAELEQLPSEVKLDDLGPTLNRILSFDAEKKRLVVDGELHLQPNERDRLLGLVKPIDDPQTDAERAENARIKQFQEAVKKVYARSSRLSLTEQLAVLLKADPERVGEIWTAKADEGGEPIVVEERMGQIDYYRTLVARYEANRSRAQRATQWEHLDQQRRELQQLKQRLVGPVKALNEELRTYADSLLTPEQLARGPVPEATLEIDAINLRTMWGLAIIGGLLIVGLLTRLAALGGAGMVLFFYLAFPPWPGVPEPPGPEHALIVNKNLIEVLALLSIAALPTGRWFGLDALILGYRTRAAQKKAAKQTK